MGLEILGMLLAGAGASYGWWRLQARRERRLGLPQRTFEDALDGDAKVVFHVAQHAVSSRQHLYMTPLHLLYGLAQDDTFTAALAKVDGDAAALEAFLLDELERVKQDQAPEEVTPFQYAISYAYYYAEHVERKVRCVDLFAYTIRIDETQKLLESSKAQPNALLFALVHGMAEPSTDLPDRTHVHVVLRNDDFTTRDFVVAILREDFGLPEDEAQTRMMQTHNEGRAIVGRYKLAEAQLKIADVRKRAREKFFPLWIGVEDC